LAEKDVDGDGKISFDEFMGGEGSVDRTSDWVGTEKRRFQNDYDKDGVFHFFNPKIRLKREKLRTIV
jgi:hypothetical protein